MRLPHPRCVILCLVCQLPESIRQSQGRYNATADQRNRYRAACDPTFCWIYAGDDARCERTAASPLASRGPPASPAWDPASTPMGLLAAQHTSPAVVMQGQLDMRLSPQILAQSGPGQAWPQMPPGSLYPDPSWQYRDLYFSALAADTQQAPGIFPPDDLSARMHNLTLEPAVRGGLAVGHALPGGLPHSLPGGPVARQTYLASQQQRRAPIEINHNKAITKKLASAVHYQQVQLGSFQQAR